MTKRKFIFLSGDSASELESEINRNASFFEDWNLDHAQYGVCSTLPRKYFAALCFTKNTEVSI